MPKPRKLQIALSETPYYHLISRCVRGAFLCGKTETYNFEHRRGWILVTEKTGHPQISKNTGHPQITALALTLTFLQPNLKQTDL